MAQPDSISAADARRLLMDAQGLCADPARKATPARIRKRIDGMGYVQIDTINTVVRAHHHILWSRFDAYEPRYLAKLHERDRALFEHYTHDAAAIPVRWFAHWLPRFRRFGERLAKPGPRLAHRLGAKPTKTLESVRARIAVEGPLMSKDFQTDGRKGGWWNWRPEKAALEFLWRAGVLGIARREHFHKVYDLMERIYPASVGVEEPEHSAHVEWVCGAALDRLGCASAPELREFFCAVDLPTVKEWCAGAVARGAVQPLRVRTADGNGTVDVIAAADWRQRLRRIPDPPDRIRLLNPFDPVIRDRKRLQRLFGFAYTLEAFTPAAKRQYGYYVMPLLEGDRLVGRVDPKYHRDRNLLEVRRVWWEPNVRSTRTRRSKLEAAVGLFAHQIGAAQFALPPA